MEYKEIYEIIKRLEETKILLQSEENKKKLENNEYVTNTDTYTGVSEEKDASDIRQEEDKLLEEDKKNPVIDVESTDTDTEFYEAEKKVEEIFKFLEEECQVYLTEYHINEIGNFIHREYWGVESTLKDYALVVFESPNSNEGVIDIFINYDDETINISVKELPVEGDSDLDDSFYTVKFKTNKKDVNTQEEDESYEYSDDSEASEESENSEILKKMKELEWKGSILGFKVEQKVEEIFKFLEEECQVYLTQSDIVRIGTTMHREPWASEDLKDYKIVALENPNIKEVDIYIYHDTFEILIWVQYLPFGQISDDD